MGWLVNFNSKLIKIAEKLKNQLLKLDTKLYELFKNRLTIYQKYV